MEQTQLPPFRIWATLKQASSLVRGSLVRIIGIFLLQLLTLIVVGVIFGFLFYITHDYIPNEGVARVIEQSLLVLSFLIISALFVGALLNTSLHHIRGKHLTMGSALSTSKHHWLKLTVAMTIPFAIFFGMGFALNFLFSSLGLFPQTLESTWYDPHGSATQLESLPTTTELTKALFFVLIQFIIAGINFLGILIANLALLHILDKHSSIGQAIRDAFASFKKHWVRCILFFYAIALVVLVLLIPLAIFAGVIPKTDPWAWVFAIVSIVYMIGLYAWFLPFFYHTQTLIYEKLSL